MAPVAIDAVNHHGLVADDGFAPGGANTAEKGLRRLLSLVRLDQRCERRADQLQNNSYNCQSHEQFDQTESLLPHDISLRGVL
ncbi:hypothetical protein D3C74_427320 [compost metagenome]